MSAEPVTTWRDDLRARVLALPPGGRLPAERALAEEWGVARMTVRSAIAALAREGLVRTVHGSGSLRTTPPFSLRVHLGSFAEAVRATGMQPHTRLLGLEDDADPPSEVADHLGAAGLPAVLVRRLRLGDDLPLALEEAWLPRTLVPDLDEDAARGSLYDHLAAADLLPDSGHETVRADLPEQDEADLLGISTSRPVLRLTRRATVRDTPVEFARAVFPADRHELSFDLGPERFRRP
ncbi:GntR family transcriptional regulator [Knoellia remsis]|uniref:GntR family transcriptional regulator n=1 Tax=Knoellia remsis TaxID=407159 RepID=A0A2T0UQ83_9MICO|nr:GntR family transcriptional regulator [Knoellia remsis]PRY60092.1 GntR family transcriptional regulator [Knoellia remsis]